ncbi:MAG: LptF/LptG family permease [Planctomycetota bacterium]
MLIYHRHLLRELLWNVAFTFTTVTFVFGIAIAVQTIYKASQLAPLLFAKMMPLLLLKVMPIVIPLSILVGVVMTFGRVAVDGELNTLKTAGIHPFWVIPPALFVGAVGFLITLMINDDLAPRAEYLSRSLLSEQDLRKLLEVRLRQGQRELSIGGYDLSWSEERIYPLVPLAATSSVPYLVAGPFAWDSSTPPEPERETVDPSKAFEENGCSWKDLRSDARGVLPLDQVTGPSPQSLAYAVTHLWCARPVRLDVEVEPGEGVGLRLGDLHNSPTWLAPAQRAGCFELRLGSGWSELLFRLPLALPHPSIAYHQAKAGGETREVRVAPLPGSICLLDLSLFPQKVKGERSEEAPFVVAGLGIIGFDAHQQVATIELRNARSLRGGNVSGERVTHEIKLGRSGREQKPKHRAGAELYALVNRLKHESAGPYTLAGIETELYKRLVTAAACLVFVVLGLPIAVIFKSANRMVSFLLAFSIALFFYYPTLMIGESLAEQGYVDPGIAMWSGSVFLTALGLTLLFVVVRR